MKEPAPTSTAGVSRNTIERAAILAGRPREPPATTAENPGNFQTANEIDQNPPSSAHSATKTLQIARKSNRTSTPQKP